MFPIRKKGVWRVRAIKGDSLGLSVIFRDITGIARELGKVKIKIKSCYLDRGKSYRNFRLKNKPKCYRENSTNIYISLTQKEMNHDFLKIDMHVESSLGKQKIYQDVKAYIVTEELEVSLKWCAVDKKRKIGPHRGIRDLNMRA